MAFYRILLFTILLITCLFPVLGQERPTVLTGRTLGPDQQPLSGVNIRLKNSQQGTFSDQNGKFKLELWGIEKPVLIFSILNFETVELLVPPHPDHEIVQVMKPASVTLSMIEITEQRKAKSETVPIDPLLSKNLSNAGSGSIEQLVKTMPGVSSHSELSPQYNVRGGNYDENLLYVNGIEIFRPFLVKTGEQEGLSFLNPDLVSAIRFSPGGFESSYGDKMSSVLDIDYKDPDKFAGTAELGALGASAHLEGRAFQNKLSYLAGFRYRNNRYLLGTLDEKGHYAPSFLDFQMLLGYDFSTKFSLNILANVANNNYGFTPETRETRFGTVNQAYQLKIYFEGNEKDRFSNRQGALSANFRPTKNLDLHLIAGSFHSDELIRYDILGQYYLNEAMGGLYTATRTDSTVLLGVGSSLVHSNDYLKASVFNIEHRGRFNAGNHQIQWGIKVQSERIHDQVNEWEMRDSAGYSLPSNDQRLELYRHLKADNQLNSHRYSAFFQDNFTVELQHSKFYFNYGGRIQYWDFNRQTIFSPRISLLWLPCRKTPLQLHAAWGVYQQMPFYKELKNRDAAITSTVKAQKSIHYVAGLDYPFQWRERPFKFSTEIWHKQLTNLIPYKVTNLDLQYFPEQIAEGFATGMELKLFGEPIPGATSWASVTLMKTEEDIKGDQYTKTGSNGQSGEIFYPGYIPQPTDQRFIFSLFFQDYLPKNPGLKMNLTLMYGSGLPFGPPQADRYMDVYRMPPYRRVDLGISKMLAGGPGQKRTNLFSGNLQEAWVSLEIFNLFDLNNTISYYWVSDFQNNMYAVPNYLTGRRLNLKMMISF
jgi:ribosomal protein L31E